ncbi:noncanonical pyrimidine nucleotidase, YjjG family [Terrilactibacillus sp. BCM23-1]|uniref:Noncanonical pyrimidine nucleotidase, YjjG family n=1 Tax=Terrilactibacillus tamarindi TaxID=2599694 RepID=A0A6N8CMW4_9BACI|nr:YjjG family noncanonical pyrimidine nucleotidase [Terrilactibacillus tamarindi]MTT31392.1 noncanonical pyrimidine nucleotidase, YjjG family [Terrilactibacillus tamarindi]
MKHYRTLLFDVDDTLLDFQAAEDFALRSLFEEQSIPLTIDIEARYKQINQGLWRSFEEGKIERDEIASTRFSLLFKEYGQEVDGFSLGMKYRNFLKEGHQLISGAIELIEDLKNKFDLYIVTNGVAETQDKRLRDAGLFPLFKDIFVSEDTGFQKPMKEFFDYVFAQIPHFSLEETLIIGDSLTSDIKGGEVAGIDTCWFNPEMTPNHTKIKPTYQIQKLEELYDIVNIKSVSQC